MPAFTTRPASAVQTARRLLNSIIAVVALTAATMTFAVPALAHDAKPTAARPQGWSYPFSCCSGYDCREVSQTSISERPEGYVIKGTGEIVAYSDTRIKNSPDGEYHWCSVAGANDGKTICLFVPPSSF
ncbi:MAG: hypothetical protein EOQ98_29350 [Mesorhizobium sp.]|uniref:hypothetical protein n=1 Tax=Mesorhizobium sp. TaxID=1871066 RepID=UPI000FE88DC3|nr:hypothetical protein [Mesorhizobium sp.]RWO94780.1 MAG: hypothetical protein EOQ98_29350 [Mesorhizobium sp.]RWP43457.1 MAG: hypothetical protein EOR05_27445 [Mesorhizobium sp.]TIM47928.1 MAG: hypothetical protein E5Y69_09235 [Mesorhizobium sp.]